MNLEIEAYEGELRELRKKREWVGLTEDEFLELAQTAKRGNYLTALWCMETELKEKNT